jgi:hypothetical protein
MTESNIRLRCCRTAKVSRQSFNVLCDTFGGVRPNDACGAPGGPPRRTRQLRKTNAAWRRALLSIRKRRAKMRTKSLGAKSAGNTAAWYTGRSGHRFTGPGPSATPGGLSGWRSRTPLRSHARNVRSFVRAVPGPRPGSLRRRHADDRGSARNAPEDGGVTEARDRSAAFRVW